MILSISRLWKEQGETDCTCCFTRARCVYTPTPHGEPAELCWTCFRTAFSAPLRVAILGAMRSGTGLDPRDWHRLRKRPIWRLHEDAIEAVRLRLYLQPAEARALGYTSWEGAIRERSVVLKWAHGMDPVVDVLIIKVLPKDSQPWRK